MEELSQLRLADRLKNLRAQEEEIQALAEQRSAYSRELNERSRQGLRAGELLTYQRYFESSHQDMILKGEKKKIAIREIDTEREQLITLTKQKKILEKLKERQWKKFSYRAEQEERNKSDERALRDYQQSSSRVKIS